MLLLLLLLFLLLRRLRLGLLMALLPALIGLALLITRHSSAPLLCRPLTPPQIHRGGGRQQHRLHTTSVLRCSRRAAWSRLRWPLPLPLLLLVQVLLLMVLLLVVLLVLSVLLSVGHHAVAA